MKITKFISLFMVGGLTPILCAGSSSTSNGFLGLSGTMWLSIVGGLVVIGGLVWWWRNRN